MDHKSSSTHYGAQTASPFYLLPRRNQDHLGLKMVGKFFFFFPWGNTFLGMYLINKNKPGQSFLLGYKISPFSPCFLYCVLKLQCKNVHLKIISHHWPCHRVTCTSPTTLDYLLRTDTCTHAHTCSPRREPAMWPAHVPWGGSRPCDLQQLSAQCLANRLSLFFKFFI